MRTPSLTLRVTSRRQAQQLIAAVRTPSLTLRATSVNRKVRRAPHSGRRPAADQEIHKPNRHHRGQGDETSEEGTLEGP